MITIIPAIDIIDGKCIRLTEGDYSTKKIYNSDPVAVAKQFEDAGIKRLHMVDLDGAKQKKIVNRKVLEKVAQNTSLKIDFGGGLQSDENLKIAFDCGAKQITAGSIAVKYKDLVLNWIEKFGAERIILGSDVRKNKIAISGWQEQTEIDLIPFLRDYIDAGIRYTISTDISRDGVLKGPAFDLYALIKKEFPELYCIASGGISCIDEVKKLDQMNVDGVIIGKAIYENRIRLEELKPFLC